MSRTASVETVNREERSCVHPTPKMIDPEFSLKIHSMEEIVNNMCHAEAVHELIMLLSFTTLFFSIPLGAFPAFLITAIIAASIDMVFVIIQRYNRPRVMRLV